MKELNTITVGCRAERLGDPRRSTEADELLVDPGANCTWFSAKALEQIGVKREKKSVSLQTASGNRIRRDIGFAVLRVSDFFTVDEVVFAEPGDRLTLGARTLSGFNARVDSKQRKLVAAGPIVAAANILERGTSI